MEDREDPAHQHTPIALAAGLGGGQGTGYVRAHTRAGGDAEVLVGDAAGDNGAAAQAGERETQGAAAAGVGAGGEGSGGAAMAAVLSLELDVGKAPSMSPEAMQELLGRFTEDQMNRYEVYRRSAFKPPAIKRLVSSVVGTTVSPKITIVLSGIAKLFVGELIEADP